MPGIFEINESEHFEALANKERIEKYLQQRPTRRELFTILADVTARIEILEIDDITPVTEKKERLIQNRERVTIRCKEIFDELIAISMRQNDAD